MEAADIVAQIYQRESSDRLTLIHFKSREGEFSDIPTFIPEVIRDGLSKMGIKSLYSHQADAIELAQSRKNVVIATATASGKTLCYNIPVLSKLAVKPESRSLYLFPTKALSSDQSTGLKQLMEEIGLKKQMHTYDGDTPPNIRQVLRKSGSIILTNPDMLHTAILPHHTKWTQLFENLDFIIIDELHQYRGVFGSHLANVIRRLKRIANFYWSHPQFIMSSATINNPADLASKIIEEDVEVVDKDGSPHGDNYLFVYNPPVVDAQMGFRKSVTFEAVRFALDCLKDEIQTIVFARSRVRVEQILSLLKDGVKRLNISQDKIRGYRGGYLPLERREIEKGLRDGSVLGVVSTNALELGIDIGQLEAAVIAGYPGSIASLRQQIGRAGRKQQSSLGILVLSNNPLDQYIFSHPKFLVESSPESGLINPDNLYVMISHIKCAAFELPFVDGERFGTAEITPILEHLRENGVVNHSNGRWFWMTDKYPADEISLRNASEGNVTIHDVSSGRTIGEIDMFSAPMLVHDQAIYIHEGVTYHVDKLDFNERKAFIRRVKVDYFTDANLQVSVSVLRENNESEFDAFKVGSGEISVTALTSVFKKVKMSTHENLGWGEIHLPEMPMDTTSWWLNLDANLEMKYTQSELGLGLQGIGNLLIGILPINLMCDPKDLALHVMVKSPHFRLPTIFIYETNAGGVGLSENIFDMGKQALFMARDVVKTCKCKDGCPACVGPPSIGAPSSKAITIKVLNDLIGD
ncbi:MAG: DEAD/DEAH box helicase [Caldisericia bacterium]